MRRSVILLLCVLAGFLFASCKREPLYDRESGVYLKTNVILGPSTVLTGNVDIDGDPVLSAKVNGKMPDRLRVLFYDVNTHEYVTEEFLPPQGGFVNVPAGTYDILVYGLGTEVTRVSGSETRAGTYAVTSYVGTKVKVRTKAGPGIEGQTEFPVIYEPDHVFVGRASNVVVPVRSELDDTIVIEMDLSTLLDTYTLEVLNVFNAEAIQSMTVYITGHAPSRYLWDKRFPKSPSAIMFEAMPDVEDGCIRTAFNTFGKFPEESNEVFLNVQITDVEGGRFQWVYDVTDQFDNPDNTGHRIVITDVMEIPDGGTGGFAPDVNDWDPVIEVVPMY